MEMSGSELAKRAGCDVEEARAVRKLGWSTPLLAAAAGVTTGYLRRLLIRGELPGTKLGRDWWIPYEVGRKWLAGRGVDLDLNS